MQKTLFHAQALLILSTCITLSNFQSIILIQHIQNPNVIFYSYIVPILCKLIIKLGPNKDLHPKEGPKTFLICIYLHSNSTDLGLGPGEPKQHGGKGNCGNDWENWEEWELGGMGIGRNGNWEMEDHTGDHPRIHFQLFTVKNYQCFLLKSSKSEISQTSSTLRISCFLHTHAP